VKDRPSRPGRSRIAICQDRTAQEVPRLPSKDVQRPWSADKARALVGCHGSRRRREPPGKRYGREEVKVTLAESFMLRKRWASTGRPTYVIGDDVLIAPSGWTRSSSQINFARCGKSCVLSRVEGLGHGTPTSGRCVEKFVADSDPFAASSGQTVCPPPEDYQVMRTARPFGRIHRSSTWPLAPLILVGLGTRRVADQQRQCRRPGRGQGGMTYAWQGPT